MTAPTTRLLTGCDAQGRAADLGRHLALHGPVPAVRPRPRGPHGLIDAVEAAGLTGRGGGAFPTARKMRAVADRPGPAVVVVNGCEGEPASLKDRLLLGVAPHLVLDGAMMAAQAVGAREIFVCVHDGARPATDVHAALAERHRAGLVTIPVRIRRVPARYVASEETALVCWLNGGEAKPAFAVRPFERGVGRRPTMVSNAETYAHVALIGRYGPDWFRGCGAYDAPGTALFTVSGAVVRPGVVEAPLGTTVAHLLDLAGGVTEPLQAVLTGGYGGAWLPPSLAGTPATAAALAAAGGALGPGLIVALPARACGPAEAARVLAWLASETAGQCGPCRFGLPAIADDFAAVAYGWADAAVHRRLQRRLEVIGGRGACRHPDGAVRFAASALRVFEPHLREHERTGGCAHAGRPGVLPLPEGW
jgi:NADH:ubiquinone oxidoreductase subunit F (NADH-binding)